jgi:Prokaryotic metallothionein
MAIPQPATAQAVKCACPSCHCMIKPGEGVMHDGKLYCSRTCAYDCTETTCVCVHDRCDEKH